MSITDFPTTSRHAILAALAVGWLGLGGAAGTARAEDLSDPPQVQISGYAEEVHPNDRAVVKLLIKVREADLEKTTTVLVQRSAALMSALRDRGFGETMLTTTGPTSDEVWEITRNDKGFETERRKLGVDGSWGVRITLEGIDRPQGRERLAAFVTAAGLGGATIDQLQFGVADEAKIQARLDRVAAKDAIDKARDLIVATGAKPGRVLKITDTAHHGWGSQADMARAMPKALLNIPVLPGDRIISAATEVTVEILTP